MSDLTKALELTHLLRGELNHLNCLPNTAAVYHNSRNLLADLATVLTNLQVREARGHPTFLDIETAHAEWYRLATNRYKSLDTWRAAAEWALRWKLPVEPQPTPPTTTKASPTSLTIDAAFTKWQKDPTGPHKDDNGGFTAKDIWRAAVTWLDSRQPPTSSAITLADLPADLLVDLWLFLTTARAILASGHSEPAKLATIETNLRQAYARLGLTLDAKLNSVATAPGEMDEQDLDAGIHCLATRGAEPELEPKTEPEPGAELDSPTLNPPVAPTTEDKAEATAAASVPRTSGPHPHRGTGVSTGPHVLVHQDWFTTLQAVRREKADLEEKLRQQEKISNQLKSDLALERFAARRGVSKQDVDQLKAELAALKVSGNVSDWATQALIKDRDELKVKVKSLELDINQLTSELAVVERQRNDGAAERAGLSQVLADVRSQLTDTNALANDARRRNNDLVNRVNALASENASLAQDLARKRVDSVVAGYVPSTMYDESVATVKRCQEALTKVALMMGVKLDAFSQESLANFVGKVDKLGVTYASPPPEGWATVTLVVNPHGDFHVRGGTIDQHEVADGYEAVYPALRWLRARWARETVKNETEFQLHAQALHHLVDDLGSNLQMTTDLRHTYKALRRVTEQLVRLAPPGVSGVKPTTSKELASDLALAGDLALLRDFQDLAARICRRPLPGSDGDLALVPNKWHQDCALVAYYIHQLERNQANFQRGVHNLNKLVTPNFLSRRTYKPLRQVTDQLIQLAALKEDEVQQSAAAVSRAGPDRLTIEPSDVGLYLRYQAPSAKVVTTKVVCEIPHVALDLDAGESLVGVEILYHHR